MGSTAQMKTKTRAGLQGMHCLCRNAEGQAAERVSEQDPSSESLLPSVLKDRSLATVRKARLKQTGEHMVDARPLQVQESRAKLRMPSQKAD